MLKKIYILFTFIFINHFANAQYTDIMKLVDGNLLMKISNKVSQRELDSILRNMNMSKLNLEQIKQGKLDSAYIVDGWRIAKVTRDYVELIKQVEQAKQMLDLSSGMHVEGKFEEVNTFYPMANYGVNEFKNNISVYSDKNSSLCIFVLRNYPNAKQVYLSGSFNRWSTLLNPMIKTDTGWVCKMNLGAGKHLYKFIVDGKWISDPENKLRESDTYLGYNSIFFKTNKTFILKGYSNAKKVVLSGTFNAWNEREIQLTKYNGFWAISVYLKEGTHSYKFIVDRNWILDPENKNIRADGMGNENSVLSIGDTLFFELKGFNNAREVFLSGNFNEWNPRELVLRFENGVWRMPYVLAPGIYFYKFIVDGAWQIDPANELSTFVVEGENSIRIIKPNHTFTLKGFENAKDVRVTGSFIDWNEPGLRMKFKNGQWEIPVFLEPGKHLYKFIIDGKWTVDPYNPLYEQNEHNTGNSFLWIHP